MTAFAAALGFEWLKFRRATVVWTASLILVGLVPALAAGLLWAAGSDSDGQLAVKARAMVSKPGWSGHFAVTGQILSVATLVVAGIVACWIFGREFTDRTAAALSSLPVTRGRIAAAKFTVFAAWAMLAAIATAAVTLATGALGGNGAPSGDDLAVLGRLFTATVLTIALCAPLALAASLGHGHLTGIAVLFALLVVTQIATVAGLGGWFPYAAPGLWLGIGGPQAAGQVTPWQLLLPLPVSAAAVTTTIVWWQRTPPP